ncbi:hypothetical protein [Thalassospira xiamenensis]|uniref:Lipoprotein n=1 Tax=Thalassospira xiamenensis TaxID=220697 RepID=A0A285RHY8_9PROT|nr:hypothetical protein [Thalassospira xiamenensis]SOB93700.1 hypothetical protein SAMN05428964_101816 [Thalassospira xiamenensis]
MLMLKNLIAGSLCVLLASCVTADPEQIGPYPSDFKETVANHIWQTFFDPYSIRDAKISYPKQGHLFFSQGWVVCTRMNAKNRMGGYVGLTTTAYLLNRGAVINSINNQDFCNSMNYFDWDVAKYKTK